MTIETITPEEIDNLTFTLQQKSEPKAEAEHYVSNKDLQAEFVIYNEKKQKWLAEGKGNPPLSEKIGKAILMIAHRRTYSRNFIGYTQLWKEAMIDDAIEACVKYAHNYNPEKYNNPFAYITQIINNALINRIKIEKTQLYIKYKAFDAAGGFNAYLDDNVVDGDISMLNETNEMYADHLKFISEFEAKYLSKKVKEELDQEDEGVLKFLFDENELLENIDDDQCTER